MAMEFIKKEYEKSQKSFDGRIVAGFEKPDGSIRYTLWDQGSLETLKIITEREGSPKLAYVGKVKLQETEEGVVPTLEEVDMSKVEYKVLKLTEKGKKMFEESRKERERKREMLRKYSSEIPDEIKDLVGGLDNEEKYAIMACLLKEGDQSYTQLKEKLGIENGVLRSNLTKLTQTALVESFGTVYFGKDKANKTAVTFSPPEESIYGVSMLGESFMKNLLRTFEPSMTKKEAREWEIRRFERLGIPPEEVRISRMKKTKELKPKALEILEKNPNIKPKELKEKLGANWEDFDRVTKRIGYKWTLKDF